MQWVPVPKLNIEWEFPKISLTAIETSKYFSRLPIGIWRSNNISNRQENAHADKGSIKQKTHIAIFAF